MTNSPQQKPFGTWKSPITSDLIVSGGVGLDQVRLDGDSVYWAELRPTEKGRVVVVQQKPDGSRVDRTPPPFNVRTRVHEYGGAAYVVSDGTLYFSNFADQRLYRQEGDGPPQAVTKEAQLRYADGLIDKSQDRMICVREDHTDSSNEAVNTITSIDLRSGDMEVLVSGNDFYAAPRLSPDGSKLAWIEWRHPNMPWDDSELRIAEFREDGSLGSSTLKSGGKNESVFQPEWSPDGVLYFVSDLSGWWNLYRLNESKVEPVCPREAEFGQPQWVFGMTNYAFRSAEKIVCSFKEDGISHLGELNTRTLDLEIIETPYADMTDLRANSESVVFWAGSPAAPSSIVRLDLSSLEFTTLHRSAQLTVDPAFLSAPKPIEFPTSGGLTAHALFYPPKNPEFEAPADEKPPLIVKSHGGPTASAGSALNMRIQYWTSRGFGVLDVNYRGSTGYGRKYREQLKGVWGIADVEDCINGAQFLVKQGLADGARLAITGGSAGGYTTLAALTFHDVFSAGASHYGVSDLEALAKDTHKFESRYLDGLIGPYPERKDLYYERSPINFTDRLSCPLIVFQGLDDKVVPPNQAETMVEALREKGLPVAYVPFEGEQHGFRIAENIKRSLDGELDFYARIFGFEPADPVEPVPIENLK